MLKCQCFYLQPITGSSYIKLSHKLRNSVKVLVNIKSNDNKIFLWCHIMHLNLPKTLRKSDKEMVNDRAYEGIKFSASKKIIGKLNKK